MKTKRPVVHTAMSAVTVAHPEAIALTALVLEEKRVAPLAVTRAAPESTNTVVIPVIPARMQAAPRKATGEPRMTRHRVVREAGMFGVIAAMTHVGTHVGTSVATLARPTEAPTTTPAQWTSPPRAVTTAVPMDAMRAAHLVKPAPTSPPCQPPPARTMAACACPS